MQPTRNEIVSVERFGLPKALLLLEMAIIALISDPPTFRNADPRRCSPSTFRQPIPPVTARIVHNFQDLVWKS